MKVLHLASSNRWTGAAAPAYTEVEALRSAGIDAHFGYVGGYRLEARIGGTPFVHEIILKKQNPWTFFSTLKSIQRLQGNDPFAIIHAHLTYDHWLASFAARNSSLRVVRTFHALRPLREGIATPFMLERTQAVAVVNEAFLRDPSIDGRPAFFTPPPVDHLQFHADGGNVRQSLGIDPSVSVVGFIGKVAPKRGFEEGMLVFRELKRMRPDVKLLIIGRGPHRGFLEQLAIELQIADDVIWAGYHEEDLAEHFRAMDVMLFTRTGSDEGHRAVSEAMACGTPVVSYPIEGIEAVLGSLAAQMTSETDQPVSLARRAQAVLNEPAGPLRAACAAETLRFGFSESARRLVEVYDAALRFGPRRS
ncbi:MAG: glycosyltransferase family 4 protein [Acidobacteriota bacterium]